MKNIPFRYNKLANQAITNFFNRDDTLSLGVCNGCQLFIELGLINPKHKEKPKMLINKSNKFECLFTSVKIINSNSIMLHGMENSVLGIWSAHGEGRFYLPLDEKQYQISAKYYYKDYPSILDAKILKKISNDQFFSSTLLEFLVHCFCKPRWYIEYSSK